MPDYSHEFSDIVDIQLHRAYLEARKGKRSTMDECSFETNALTNLINLRDSILNHEYHPSRGIAFITRKPVIREIFAAPFRDRIVHHFLFNIVNQWWDDRFIYDSYSCRQGKGTLFGIQRLADHIRRVSQNYTIETYVIKLDIQGYFMSLPRDGLYQRVCWGLDRQFPQGGSIYNLSKYLWREIIFDDPTRGVRRRGSPDDWKDLPKTKSLFCQPPGRGIVIGNLSSQLLSNIYLDQLDRFVTQTLGYKHYGRYVDDFFLVVTADQLAQAERDLHVIEDYVTSLQLTLHPNKRYIQNVKRGAPFLGAIVYPYRLIPGTRIARNFSDAARLYMNGRRDDETIISYLGHLKHFQGTALSMRVFDSVGWDYRP